MKKGSKIIAILSVIAVLVYAISAIYLLIVNPTNTYIVQHGNLSEEDEAIGYIIRDEVIVKGEDYKNGIYAIASEGKRVAVGEAIFRYYSDSESQIKTQISGLNYKIQELLEQEKTPSSADIKSIEAQIEEKIQEINTLTNYQEIVERKKNIDNLITKKINFIGEVTENKEIKQLIKERNSSENQLKNGSEYQIAPIGGIVSYRVDGLETKLSPSKFNEITEKYLNDLDLKTGKIVTTSNEYGKVIDNFKCYIGITMNSKNAKVAEVEKSVDLRINDKEYEAKIVQINEESGKRTIIFQINNMTEDLISHRKMVVDVIWSNESGLKVPKQALIQKNGLYYVIRNKAGVQTELLVKVQKQTEKFAIIRPYKDSELKEELGYDSNQIRKYKEITNYDEIVINK